MGNMGRAFEVRESKNAMLLDVLEFRTTPSKLAMSFRDIKLSVVGEHGDVEVEETETTENKKV